MNRNVFLGTCVGLALVLPHLSSAQQIAYPDLQVRVPVSEISIGHPTPSTRELRFSHITWNGGVGPLEIRPVYDPLTGSAQGFQRLYTYDSSGNLKLVMDSPIAIPMVFIPPDDYHFPIAQFGLYFDVGGSIGELASPSPKSDFCMGSNTVIGGLPHTPPTSVLGDCQNPNGRLGLSVGWGDKYDYTDTGENIDITTLPDGVYWLRGIADPFHYFLAVNSENNITDTQLRISGNTVTVLQQTHPDSTPPSIAVASPAPIGAAHPVSPASCLKRPSHIPQAHGRRLQAL